MAIFDCFQYFNEDHIVDLRLNILNKFVDKFIVVESSYSHSGKAKNFNFDINDYPKFKDKIIYLKINKEPDNLYSNEEILNNPIYKRLNSIKRIEQSYDYMKKGIEEANDEDLIIISDNDEIPNLKSIKFKKSKRNFLIFKQLLFYYKFNYYYDLMPWHGSKACKKNT